MKLKYFKGQNVVFDNKDDYSKEIMPYLLFFRDKNFENCYVR